MEISGKTAIVTGAASGIGLGIATALAEAGANVVMADIQKDAVEQAAHGLSGTNKRVMPVRIDVTQEQSVVDALTEAERNFGKLHIACNNAGVPMHGTKLVDVPLADWEFRDRRERLGHHSRHPPLRSRDPEAWRGGTHRQHGLGRRPSKPAWY
jgi:NAD(P)-dependent dehydrogenase (short-subunit alcohol dehydrogenase family)